MEKPGMVRGRGFYGAGLLSRIPSFVTEALKNRISGLPAFCLLVALFLFPPALGGQEAGSIAVMLESSPDRPVLGGSWRVSVLVDHPVPEEVTVIPPELPPSLTFAQSRKETRFVRTSAEQGTRWTLAEFLFVPHRTGEIVLEPFEALVGDSRILTPAARTTVIAPDGEQEEYRPRLVWDTPPVVLRIGEAAELSLRILDGDPRSPLRRLPLGITAPVEALLEEIPLTGEESEQGLALRLRIIPLEGRRVSLGPFPLSFEGLTLEVPALSIALDPPARPAPLPAPTGTDGGALAAEPAAFDKTPPAFPEIRGEPFPLFRRSYRETLDKARDRWRQGLYAEALGELRRGERDLLSGPALGATRRAAEGLLGLPLTEDETWRPRNFFTALIILSFCLLPPAIALSTRRGGAGKKRLTSPLFNGYSIAVFVLIGLMGFGIAALARSPGGFEGLVQGNRGAPGKRQGNAAAVLRSCAAYRVPDVRGAVSARWLEGQPALVRSASDDWAYAESSGGDAGWVSQDNVIYY
ncbi:MAG: hypothetical protein LBG14_01915 [Treponema sp.]|jgi:hypothetical protein|nr:hypothetical protein [Treponema sp.]